MYMCIDSHTLHALLKSYLHFVIDNMHCLSAVTDKMCASSLKYSTEDSSVTALYKNIY